MPFTAEEEQVLLPLAAPATDNRGTDFWLAFPGNNDLTSSLSLFITGDQATSGSVTIPGLNFSYQFQIQAGQLIRVSLPRSAQSNASDRVENIGVHVTSQHEITVYGLNQRQHSTDAYLALPKDILGREYINLTYPITTWGSFFLAGSRFMVTAPENNTRLTITPSVTVGSRPGGTPFSITLNQGQTYQLSVASVLGADLSGSIISADKPVAVFGAHECTSIPSTYPACDHIVEQLFPTSSWGKNFVSMPLATRTRGDTFRILASQNNTSVYVNGNRVAVLNRGHLHERIISGPANITADRPILVAQYSNSSDYDGVISDPFMMLLPPYEQFLTEYRVATPSSGIARNFINVVAPAAAVGSIRINGTAIPASSFVSIGSSGFKGASVSVALGTHTLTGSMPFGVSVYGFDNYDSYGYPGGLSLSPVATVTTIVLNPSNATATIGTDHCVTARVRDQSNNPVPGIRVDFAVTGVHTTTGSATTNSSGDAGFCYRGTVVGRDTVRASVGTLTTTASVTWIAPTPTHTPTPTRTPPSTATATNTPPPTATPPLATPTATPDFPVCSVTLDKIAYPSTANVNGQVGVTLRLTGDCSGEIGAAVDVALVIDRSQSMCGAKLDQAQAAGQVFLDSMALPPDQASVISFAGTANMHTGLTTNRTQAVNALYNISCGGVSRLDVGINRAFDEMTGPRRVAGHTPAVILLTDGNPTGTYANDVRAAAQRLHDAGIQVYTVGLGADVNADLLREIATAPDHYYQSPTPADLVQIYSRLAGEVRIAPGFNVNLTDIVSQQFEIVPGSFSGAVIPQVNGRSLSWYIPRIEQGVTEVGFAVRPLQCGTFNTNQLAQVSYDDNRGVRHTRNFPVPSITVTGCSGGLTDVYVRDNVYDTGAVPSAQPWWDSPDIWVRHSDDGGQQHQTPQAGQRNYLYARVQNRGTTVVNSITVTLFYGASGLGLGWPDGWTQLNATRTIASIAPGSSAVVSIPWDVPNIAGHFCFRVHVTASQDPLLDYRVGWENNVAQRNLNVVAYPQPPAGECRFGQNGIASDQFPFDVINTLNSSSLVDVELTASGLPNSAQAWLLPGALAGRWSSLDGLELLPDGRLRVLRFPARLYGIRLNPGEIRSVTLRVDAPVNSQFTAGLAEYVRGNLVGGNSYQRALPACPLNLPLILKAPQCIGGTYTPPDVILVIDRSGSMQGQPLAAAKSAAIAFLQHMDLSVEQAGIASFESSAMLNHQLSHNQSSLIAAVNSLSAGGVTAIGDGIAVAQVELGGPRGDPSHVKAMVVLSDGYSNAGQNPITAANNAKQAGTVIFTIGLGSSVDVNLMRQIATSPDHYYYAPTPADLEDIYLEIAGQVGCTP